MPTYRRIAAIAVVALALDVLLPGSGLAADPTVSGTVTRDGAPAQGADVNVVVQGNDMVWHTTTDANGAWAVAADIAVGQKLQVSAVGAVTQSSPDKDGCVNYASASGQLELTVDAVPVAPVTVALDHPIDSRVCSATATPRVVPTPPATDAGTPSATRGWGMPAVAVVLAVLALLAVGPLARSTPRRS